MNADQNIVSDASNGCLQTDNIPVENNTNNISSNNSNSNTTLGELAAPRKRSRSSSTLSRGGSNLQYVHLSAKDEGLLRDRSLQLLSGSYLEEAQELGCDEAPPEGNAEKYRHNSSFRRRRSTVPAVVPEEVKRPRSAFVGVAAVCSGVLLGAVSLVLSAVVESRTAVFVLLAVQLLVLCIALFRSIVEMGAVQVTPITDETESRLEKDSALLMTIIPEDVIDMIHQGSRCIATRHEALTFSFTDLVGFTKMAMDMPHTELVLGLNTLFTIFDELAEELNVLKVKTIGDCYMAVSGFRVVGSDHIKNMFDWSVAVLKNVSRLSLPELRLQGIQVRVGMASGEAVSGVLGRTKPIYDFWGTTVNMASRMEALSRPSRINCTHEVAEHLKTYGVEFETLSGQFVKGKGKTDTYLAVVGNLKINSGKQNFWEAKKCEALSQLEEMQSKEAFGQSMKDMLGTINELSSEPDLERAVNLVVRTVERLIFCDRATLFLVDKENSQLWSYHEVKGGRIRMGIDQGAAGWTAVHAEPLIIHNVYEDERFNPEIDIKTGYVTNDMLCCPVKRGDKGEVLAVIQAINKTNGKFSMHDAALLSLLGNQAGVHLMNGQLSQSLRSVHQRCADLGNECSIIMESTSIAAVCEAVRRSAHFFQCESAQLYLYESGRVKDKLMIMTGSAEFALVSMQSSAGTAAQTLEPQLVTKHIRDKNSGDSELCFPISTSGVLTGVLQLKNRALPGAPLSDRAYGGNFTEEDVAMVRGYVGCIAASVSLTQISVRLHSNDLLCALMCRLLADMAAKEDVWQNIACTSVETRVPEMLGCEGAALWFSSPDNDHLLKHGARIPISGLTGKVIRDGITFVSGTDTPVSREDSFSDAIDSVAVRTDSLIIARIACGGRILGAIQVANKIGREDFSPEDGKFVGVLAETLGGALLPFVMR